MKKLIIIGVVLVVVGVGVYLWYKKSKAAKFTATTTPGTNGTTTETPNTNSGTSGTGTSTTTTTPTGGAVSPGTTSGGTTVDPANNFVVNTISPATASYIAEKLFDAMKMLGTNESEVKSIVATISTRTDWDLVSNAFGERNYPGILVDNRNLASWLAIELGTSSTLWKEIVAKFNIQKQ